MANLNITELGEQGRDSGNNLAPVAKLPAKTVQNVAIGGSSTQSSAFGATTGMIRVRADIACAILVGTNPTALTTSTQMDANQTEYFSVPLSGGYKIAVIAI